MCCKAIRERANMKRCKNNNKAHVSASKKARPLSTNQHRWNNQRVGEALLQQPLPSSTAVLTLFRPVINGGSFSAF